MFMNAMQTKLISDGTLRYGIIDRCKRFRIFETYAGDKSYPSVRLFFLCRYIPRLFHEI